MPINEIVALLSPHVKVQVLNSGFVLIPSKQIAVAVLDERAYNDKLLRKNNNRLVEDDFAAEGYRAIQFWGSEWRSKKPILTRMLLSAVGADQTEKVGARSCVVDPAVDSREARVFYEANHPQGTCANAKDSVGLRTKDGKLVACMSFSMTADRRGNAAKSWAGASLTRFATACRVPGAASRLLKAWREANPGVAIMSYSDPRIFSGATYAALGFTQVKRIPPDYNVFVPSTDELRHKSAFQRKSLNRWLQALGRMDIPSFDHTCDERTEFEMEDAMGVLRVWNTGLIRWELAGE